MHKLRHALAPALAALLIGSTALTQGPANAAPTDLTQPSPDKFNIATFNVLGAHHRASRSTPRRMDGTVKYLRKHDVDVVGFQEFEKSQYAAFVRETRNKWTVVGAPSRRSNTVDRRNAIAFKKSRFKLVSASSMAVPYFHGNKTYIPVVTLRSVRSGATFTMINTHNPADVRGPAQRYRNEATRRQVAKVKELRREGRTVFVTGDMNEKAPYFCKMTRSGQMKAASGGSTGRKCQAPSANGIDWIFGSRDVDFDSWRSDTSTRSRGVSDHPMVVSGVTLPVPDSSTVPAPAS